MKFPEKLYLGFQDNGTIDPLAPKLAFATPWGSDAAFLKRKETVDQWAQGRWTTAIYHGLVIDNNPVVGFKFDNVVSRWSTSNKWFTVTDPRGFQLQISAENLSYILNNCTIVSGALHGEFIWARDGGDNFLCSTDHQAYQAWKNPAMRRQLQPGDVVKLSKREKGAFVGVYRDVQLIPYDRSVPIKIDPEPWYVFLTSRTWGPADYYHLKRHPKGQDFEIVDGERSSVISPESGRYYEISCPGGRYYQAVF